MERKKHIDECLSGKVLLVAMALSVAVSVSASAAVEDLTVLEGQSLTLSGRSDYGRVVVNGDLVIAPGAEITAASLCVATNITGTASLVMEENSSLNVTGEGTNTIFGISGGSTISSKHVILSSLLKAEGKAIQMTSWVIGQYFCKYSPQNPPISGCL